MYCHKNIAAATSTHLCAEGKGGRARKAANTTQITQAVRHTHLEDIMMEGL